MAGRYRKANENNRSRFYILLSVIFVGVMLKWGVPYFMNVIAGNGGQKAAALKDIIPPQVPITSALPEATNSSSLIIEGYTEGGAAIDVLVDDKVTMTDKANVDGSFAIRISLATGQNRIQVRAADESGNVSSSAIKIVDYDDKPIEVTIFSPKNGNEYFGKNGQIIEIKGEVSKADSEVTINNSFVVLDKTGSFLHRFQLAEGSNEIKVIATDKAGNTSENILKTVYTP